LSFAADGVAVGRVNVTEVVVPLASFDAAGGAGNVRVAFEFFLSVLEAELAVVVVLLAEALSSLCCCAPPIWPSLGSLRCVEGKFSRSWRLSNRLA